MNLKNEIANGSYSADSATALSELKAVTVTSAGKLDAGKKLKLKAFAPDIWAALENGQADTTTVTLGLMTLTVGSICSAALANLQSEKVDLELDDPQTVLMLQALEQAGILTTSQINIVNSVGNVVDSPFARATLRDVAEARGDTNAQSIAWNGQNFLIIDVSDPPVEQVRPFLTFENDTLGSRPAGRTTTVNTEAGRYVINLHGLQYNAISSTIIKVEFFIPCTFSLSLY